MSTSMPNPVQGGNTEWQKHLMPCLQDSAGPAEGCTAQTSKRLHENGVDPLVSRIKPGFPGIRCPLEPAAAHLCSVARHQFGSTSGGSAVFLCPQDEGVSELLIWYPLVLVSSGGGCVLPTLCGGTVITQMLHCPYCQGTDIVRHGTTSEGKQRYRCRECLLGRGRTFLLEYTYTGQAPTLNDHQL